MTFTETPSSHHSFHCSLSLFSLLLHSFASFKQCFLLVINTRLINSSFFCSFHRFAGFLVETLLLNENRRAKFPSAQRRNIKPCREKKPPQNHTERLRILSENVTQIPALTSTRIVLPLQRNGENVRDSNSAGSCIRGAPGSDPGAPLTGCFLDQTLLSL